MLNKFKVIQNKYEESARLGFAGDFVFYGHFSNSKRKFIWEILNREDLNQEYPTRPRQEFSTMLDKNVPRQAMWGYYLSTINCGEEETPHTKLDSHILDFNKNCVRFPVLMSQENGDDYLIFGVTREMHLVGWNINDTSYNVGMLAAHTIHSVLSDSGIRFFPIESISPSIEVTASTRSIETFLNKRIKTALIGKVFDASNFSVEEDFYCSRIGEKRNIVVLNLDSDVKQKFLVDDVEPNGYNFDPEQEITDYIKKMFKVIKSVLTSTSVQEGDSVKIIHRQGLTGFVSENKIYKIKKLESLNKKLKVVTIKSDTNKDIKLFARQVKKVNVK